MKIAWKVAVIILAIAAYFYFHSPYQTKLPISPQTADSVRSSLLKLKPADRALVEAYMERTHGGTPDSFSLAGSRRSAITFADAINEQKKFMEDTGKSNAEQASEDAANDAKYDPLRMLASVDVIKREFVPFSIADVPLSQREDPFFKPPHPTEGSKEVLVATIRLKNTTSQTITALNGQVSVYKSQFKRGDPLGFFVDCSINLSQSLNPDETKDYPCQSRLSQNYISDRDREFVAASSSDYIVNWRPSQITLADGKTIKPDVQ